VVPALTKAISGAERILAVLLFVSLLPLLAAVAGIVYLLSGKAPLVAHNRVGRFGQPFWMLKFRTMWSAARGGGPRRFIEKLGDTPVPEWKGGADPRVTSRFGRFLRKYSIDELPQLWHVLTGEMSLVGPRPETPYHCAQFARTLPAYMQRVQVRFSARYVLFRFGHDFLFDKGPEVRVKDLQRQIDRLHVQLSASQHTLRSYLFQISQTFARFFLSLFSG
jgi:hypothetical protein